MVVSDPTSLLDTTSSYIDTFRSHEEVEDIKISVDKARKAYGSDFGKIQRRGKKGEEVIVMNEEEFAESGGLGGYIERARSLLVRKKYRPAQRQGGKRKKIVVGWGLA